MSNLDDDIRRRRDADGPLGTTGPRPTGELRRDLDDDRAIRRDPDRTMGRNDAVTGPGTRRRRGGPLKWLLALLVIAALAIGGFFLLGGDVDVDTDGGNIEAPSVDVDVDSPDVSVNTPNVDVDPGSVDVNGGDTGS